ncbi:MAG TPA: DUF1801 domain-containing protein [Terracidiphilus sp.]|nr:DUF1801 domain-containing protein [Terracidiphilus sp.]
MMQKRSSNAKSGTPAKAKSVDEYFASVPEPARSTLAKMRAAIRSALPREATETISYSIPAFKLKKIVVWFAAFQNHCSLFPTGAVIEQFKDELEGYTISKGTIQFPIGKPLPSALIKKLVKARLEQSQGKRRS